MKKHIIYSILLIVLFSACEKKIDLDLESTEPFLAVDAFLTDQNRPQKVLLTYSQPYFDNTNPKPALGATVRVLEVETEKVYFFTDEDDNGSYEWIPSGTNEVFGKIGSAYALQIGFQGVDYVGFSRMDSVPEVDSITFEYTRKNSFIDQDYYVGEFWARDLSGVGNAYWIKTWKNGKLMNQPDEINIAYDAGGSPGIEVDSLIFIQPIRTAMNPFDQGQDDSILPPYIKGDSAYVEIHSITPETWIFLARVMDETFRPGGFAELFATPLANSPTNIAPVEEDVRVAGFFSVSSVSSLGVVVNEETIRDKLPD